MIDVAKRASAKSIIAVIPHFGWARQDRKDKPRVSIGAKARGGHVECGRNKPADYDGLACRSGEWILRCAVRPSVCFGSVLLPYIKSLNLKNIVIAAPDVGGSKRASTYSKYLEC